jgi:hypothetical protein
MNEMFNGGETVHRTNHCVIVFQRQCDVAFGRGGGTYAS